MTPEQIKEQRDWLDTLTGYTPGPWRVSYERGTTQIRSADNDSLMCDETYYPWVPDNQNDWTIIAAAPDLRDRYATALDAIERLQKQVHSLDHALNFIQSDASWTPKHPACESILKRISALRKGKDQ